LFDYVYSGLSIYLIDEKVEVDDVVETSPAAIAGFKKGDIIMSVNNDFSNNLQSYKNIIQSSNQRIRFLVLRDGKPEILTMKTIRII
jgi:S1-C subfamily serine protease